MLCAIAVLDTELSQEISAKLTRQLEEYQNWQIEIIDTFNQFENYSKVHLLITDYLLETEVGYQTVTELAQQNRLDQVFFYTDCSFLQLEFEQALCSFEIAREIIFKELGCAWLIHKVTRYLSQFNRLVHASERVMIQCDGATILLNPTEIIFIEKIKKQIIFHTADQEYHTYGTLDDLERRLPAYFCRSHRSYLINLRKTRTIRPHGRSFIVSFSNIDKKAILSYDRQKQILDQYC